MTAKSRTSAKKLFESLKALPVTLLATVITRAELLLLDLEQARERVTNQLIWLLVALFSIGVGVILLVLLVVIASWDTQRLGVLGILTGLFLFCGFFVSWAALQKMKSSPPLFHSSYAGLTRKADPTVFSEPRAAAEIVPAGEAEPL
ncbi:MAG TPA: phage holin family protein [Burkholderiales bacterium]|nr:phage holin family protein [Burkholderiales bacterium]